MPRYNIFFPVHKGLRALLFETAQRLQHTNFCDAGEAADAIEQVNNVVSLFEIHAQKEDNYVLAAIAAYEPSVVAAFEQEHEEDHVLGQALQNWLTAYGYSVAKSAKISIGEELTKTFADYTVFNLRHMAKEERVVNPLLWRYYTDAELLGITDGIVKSISAQEMAFFGRWMVRGLNNAEILGWLHGVKNTAPQPVFDGLLSIAEAELAPHRWNLVKDALME
ncbi:MAG TPA: hemerythrin domain-containing protein, partial [Flavisolibacter sp.]|nr:hemerythrin domain-containing protein [Flavisolibacter sp.]